MFNKTLTILAFFNLLSLTSNANLATTPVRIDEATEVADQMKTDIVKISPYDYQFRTISEKEGNDWRLLCAMAYHESRFKTDVVSHCGARGILQVMPRVASQFDITAEQLTNVEDNIYVANRVVSLIDDMLGLPATVSQEDRVKLTLAAYNCGIGRVADARRLARTFGEETTSWDVVAKYLERMNTPEYYELDAVKYGRFTGAGQTLAYVRNVVGHYNDYCLLAMR